MQIISASQPVQLANRGVAGSAGAPSIFATRNNGTQKGAPRRKKARASAAKRLSRVQKPLSVLKEDFPDVPVADIDAYVRRSKETREREVAQGTTPGKVKRPMNAFMLYRKAYQHLAKNICTRNNHQLVSQVCGDGWPLEPSEIKNRFNEWARLERENHQKAHPGYKFSPSKPVKKVQRSIGLNEKEVQKGEQDWSTGLLIKKVGPRAVMHQTGASETTPGSVFETYYDSNGPEVSVDCPVYHLPECRRLDQESYNGPTCPGNQYYQQSVLLTQNKCEIVEDITMARTPPRTEATHVAGFGNIHYPSVIDTFPGGMEGIDSKYYAAEYYSPERTLVEEPNAKWYEPTMENWEFGRESAWIASSPLEVPLYELFSQDPHLSYLKGEDGGWQMNDEAR